MDAISATQQPVTRPEAGRTTLPGPPAPPARCRPWVALGVVCLLTACTHTPGVEITRTRNDTRRPGERPGPTTETPAPVPPGIVPELPDGELRMESPQGWGRTAQLMVGREFDPILFDPMIAELTNAGRRQAGEYAAWLREHPHVWLVLTGFSDAVPSDEFALNLGMARAMAVGEFMVQRGVEGKRLFALSYGEDRPLYDAENAEAQRLNNRVEIYGFVAPEGADEAPGMVSVFGPKPPDIPAVKLDPISIPLDTETHY